LGEDFSDVVGTNEWAKENVILLWRGGVDVVKTYSDT
jgi:hypothetical protein